MTDPFDQLTDEPEAGGSRDALFPESRDGRDASDFVRRKADG